MCMAEQLVTVVANINALVILSANRRPVSPI